MRLRTLVTTARVGGSTTTHRLIDLNQLGLRTIALPKLFQKEAMQKSVEIASKEGISGFVLQYKNGEVKIVCVKTAKIPTSHPQIVKQLCGTQYYTMRSHTAV